MAEMDTEDELREIRLGKERNPKEIRHDMSVIEAKYKLKIGKKGSRICPENRTRGICN